MPKISVIIPVYNAENLLSKCINSILQQNFSDIELILVNDGSTDQSGEICDDYAREDCRIRVIHQNNRGASAARNSGLDVATGQYVTFVDSDDFIPEDYLSQLLITAQNNCDLAVCPLQRPGDIHTASTKEILVDFTNPSQENKSNFSKLFGTYVLHGPCTKLYKRSIIEQNKVRFNEDITQGEDCVFVFTYLRGCNTIRFRSRPVYYYYENVTSVTHQVRKDRFPNGVRVNTVYLDCINEKKFMTDEIEQVWARATFKDAYHGIEDILDGKTYCSCLDLLEQVDAIIKHPCLIEAMKVARISGYNKTLVLLMKRRKTVLYCAYRGISGLKNRIIKGKKGNAKT